MDGVATHHFNPCGSGVARFNEILAQRTGVDLVSVFDPRLLAFDRPLLSFKASEMSERERLLVHHVLDQRAFSPSVFLHEYHGLELEDRLVQEAERVYCGNLEVQARVSPLTDRAQTLWSPGLILDRRRVEPAEVTVFSFGMAHKIRTDMFRRLRSLLEQTGCSYRLIVSAANHETASLRDADLVFSELRALFGDELYFMGTLSDVAVYDWIKRSTFFAAFFLGGARANNGSIACAMEHGAVVLTNLDEHSPPEFVHMHNVIDITRTDSLPRDPVSLEAMSAAAMETGEERSWNALVEHFRPAAVEALPDQGPARPVSV